MLCRTVEETIMSRRSRQTRTDDHVYQCLFISSRLAVLPRSPRLVEHTQTADVSDVQRQEEAHSYSRKACKLQWRYLEETHSLK